MQFLQGLVRADIQRDQFPDKLFAPAKRDFLLPDGSNPVYDKEMRSELFSQGTLMLRIVIQVSMFLAIHFASWITSLEFTSVASSVVLVSTAPLWVAILAPITIREQVGRPPHAELQRIRLQRAIRFLAETDLAIPRIAEAVGYTTASYFIQVFRK